MKRTLWIFAVLATVLVLSISAVAATTGGARYQLRGASDWLEGNDGGTYSNVGAAQLYGQWRDISMTFSGAAADSSAATTFNLTLSGDFDYKNTAENGKPMYAYGGSVYTSSVPLTISGDTTLIVTGKSGSKIDYDNGNIAFYGGSVARSNNDLIAGDTYVILSGDSPVFIQDPDDDWDFMVYGGSTVGNAASLTTTRGSHVYVRAPWKMSGENNAWGGVVYGGSSSFSNAISVTKGMTEVELNNADCSVSMAYGGGNSGNSSISKIEGDSDIKNYAEYLFSNAGESVLTWIIEGAKKVIDIDYKIPLPKCVQDAID
ncbi:MAG: hypothetical protein Q4F74_08180, partial [Synergistaceae bacterium]|nr:hypothetical protein [Synergistaceae bacterium]